VVERLIGHCRLYLKKRRIELWLAIEKNGMKSIRYNKPTNVVVGVINNEDMEEILNLYFIN